MVLNPAIIALLAGSWLICAFAFYASFIGIQIIWGWDMESGSEMQLTLERKTYLISAVLSHLLAFELLSLFLFVYTADNLHTRFVGAMCAAGTLNVNNYGYPTLVVKIVNFILCGIWLLLNYLDNKGFDYPLIKAKYKFLIFITASLLLETVWQTRFFLGLKADVITSCCGTLFSEDVRGIGGEIAALPPRETMVLFYLSMALMLRTGIHFYVTGRAARVFSYFSNWLFLFALISIVSFISLYVYELPTHHCPFCLLQKEYHYLGYLLYLSLFAAGIMGASIGIIDRLGGKGSLAEVRPILQRRLCLFSMFFYMSFTIISTYPMVVSDFKLELI